MKKIVIYTLITFIFSVFASSCEDNKDNSLVTPINVLNLFFYLV